MLFLSHSLQAFLTWSQTPTTYRHPRTCSEPTCTLCAVQQRRSAWPGKELGTKHKTESLGIVCGSHPEPGKVAEPLRAMPSTLPGLRGEEKGRGGLPSTYIHYLRGPLLHCDINLNTSPGRMGCPIRKLSLYFQWSVWVSGKSWKAESCRVRTIGVPRQPVWSRQRMGGQG